MPRRSRTTTQKGLYHIYVKGNVNHPLFKHHTDFLRFKDIMFIKANQFNGSIIAYTLQKESIHIILEEHLSETLASIVHGMLTLYAKYYHHKYGTSGSLYSGRYHSDVIHHIKELICRVRYIHQRPKIQSNHSLNYPYSSFSDYASPMENSPINRCKLYRLFHRSDDIKAANLFKSIHYATEQNDYFAEQKDLYARVKQAKLILKDELSLYNVTYDSLQKSSDIRDHVILKLHKQSQLNQQEIADLLDLSRHVIGRVIRYYKTI